MMAMSVMTPSEVKMIRRMGKGITSQPPVSGPNKQLHFTNQPSRFIAWRLLVSRA